MISMKTNLCLRNSPMMQIAEEDKSNIQQTKAGGEKYYVYVRDPSTKNIKKVTFGDAGFESEV